MNDHASPAIRNVIGRMLMGFTVRDNQITLTFGGDRELVIEGWLDDAQPGVEVASALLAHYGAPPPRHR